MKKHHVVICWIVIVCVAGIVGFLLGRRYAPVVVSTTQSLRENNDKYTFIHPLLVSGRVDIDTPSPQYVGLSKSVANFVQSEKSSGLLTDASVYFVDYKAGGGGSFALNENDKYAPASMLKVVVMIGYLKESDDDKSAMNESFVYDSTLARSLEDIPFESPSLLKIGKSYTVEDLIRRMIIDSDNGAMNVLLSHIDDSYLSQVYSDLGLAGPTDSGNTYTISAKDYALFFRILYNATYLSRGSSEKALALLSQATFKDGLVAGLPTGTLVAHKYGEHIVSTSGGIDSVELHDCGYVYASDAPYLLCVMTKSKTLLESEKVISGVSRIIYNRR